MTNLYSFYRSSEWKKFREYIILDRLINGDTICEHCGQPIVHKYDTIVHHKTALTEQNVSDVSIALNPDNVQLVHHACHNEIHKRFGTYNRHIYIVYGSPLAGKKTYVDSVAMKDDIIIDIDRIYSAINNFHSKRVFSNVMDLYRVLIDMIKTRKGQWVTAYVIRSFPVPIERERLANELDAELVHIDTDIDTCLSRCKTSEQKIFVNDYFQKFVK